MKSGPRLALSCSINLRSFSNPPRATNVIIELRTRVKVERLSKTIQYGKLPHSFPYFIEGKPARCQRFFSRASAPETDWLCAWLPLTHCHTGPSWWKYARDA